MQKKRGRPPKGTPPKPEHLRVRIDPELQMKIASYMQALGESRSVAIRAMLRAAPDLPDEPRPPALSRHVEGALGP